MVDLWLFIDVVIITAGLAFKLNTLTMLNVLI